MKRWDTTRNESQNVVLFWGLVIIVLLVNPMIAAIAEGWLVAAGLGTALLAIAWFVPTGRTARMLRLLVAGFGVVSMLGAVFDLVT
jgi:hypothetical protein